MHEIRPVAVSASSSNDLQAVYPCSFRDHFLTYEQHLLFFSISPTGCLAVCSRWKLHPVGGLRVVIVRTDAGGWTDRVVQQRIGNHHPGHGNRDALSLDDQRHGDGGYDQPGSGETRRVTAYLSDRYGYVAGESDGSDVDWDGDCRDALRRQVRGS